MVAVWRSDRKVVKLRTGASQGGQNPWEVILATSQKARAVGSFGG